MRLPEGMTLVRSELVTRNAVLMTFEVDPDLARNLIAESRGEPIDTASREASETRGVAQG